MPFYDLHYTTDKKLLHTLNAASMAEAVAALVGAASKSSVTLSDISVCVTGESSGGRQKFCNDCLLRPASYGLHDVWFCYQCYLSQDFLPFKY